MIERQDNSESPEPIEIRPMKEEDLWWKRKNEDSPWLEKLIRI